LTCLFFLLIPISLLGVSGLVSGIINGNSFFITAQGIFDYIKYFLVVFIYSAFITGPDEFKKIFRLLLGIALLYAAVALIQFLWATGSVYVLKKDISDTEVYVLVSKSFININFRDFCWRFEIFRTPYAFVIGLYGLLILTVYYYTFYFPLLFVALSFMGLLMKILIY
jgi:hypothetical protein